MFEIVNPPTVDCTMAANGETEHPTHSTIEVANPRMMDSSPRKIVLPRRSERRRAKI